MSVFNTGEPNPMPDRLRTTPDGEAVTVLGRAVDGGWMIEAVDDRRRWVVSEEEVAGWGVR